MNFGNRLQEDLFSTFDEFAKNKTPGEQFEIEVFVIIIDNILYDLD